MKLSGLASFFLVASVALADTVSYDETYDNASLSVDVLACFAGGPRWIGNGGAHHTRLAPQFPVHRRRWRGPRLQLAELWDMLAAAYAGTGNTVNILAVDHSAVGTFNIALEAMNTLTNGNAVELGRVNVTAEQVAASVCGL
ncbi:eliciting plant response-like protein [Mycena galopus ATCC 62051]|nr:eliciting plant response-like protein [Mycena galopus ATCC 62051]